MSRFYRNVFQTLHPPSSYDELRSMATTGAKRFENVFTNDTALAVESKLGEGLELVGTLTSQPEIVAAGTALSVGTSLIKGGKKTTQGLRKQDLNQVMEGLTELSGNYNKLADQETKEMLRLDEVAKGLAGVSKFVKKTKLQEFIDNKKQLNVSNAIKEKLTKEIRERKADTAQQFGVLNDILQTEKSNELADKDFQEHLLDELKETRNEQDVITHQTSIVDSELQAVGDELKNVEKELDNVEEEIIIADDPSNYEEMFNAVKKLTNPRDRERYIIAHFPTFQTYSPENQVELIDFLINTGDFNALL